MIFSPNKRGKRNEFSIFNGAIHSKMFVAIDVVVIGAMQCL